MKNRMLSFWNQPPAAFWGTATFIMFVSNAVILVWEIGLHQSDLLKKQTLVPKRAVWKHPESICLDDTDFKDNQRNPWLESLCGTISHSLFAVPLSTVSPQCITIVPADIYILSIRTEIESKVELQRRKLLPWLCLILHIRVWKTSFSVQNIRLSPHCCESWDSFKML